MITYGSLCTGYDGIGLGLQIAGVKVQPRWLAEDNEAMSLVLKREHEGVPNVGDIKVAPWHLAPAVQLMSSGDPCQSISIAGRQAGREDPRFLWPWVRAAYRAVRPGALFFENVANIVPHDGGRTLQERHEHLRADGYEVRWAVIGACAVGAPHHRHRYYAVAAYVGPDAPEAVRVDGGKAICGAPRSGSRFLLPSPRARDGDGRGEGDPEYWRKRLAERGRTNGMPLGAAVNLLPSPRATDGERGGEPVRSSRTGTGGTLLDAVYHLPPTPMAGRSGSNRGGAAGREGQPVRPSLDSASALLPTPRATDIGTEGRRSSEGWRPQLGQAVHAMLPTPTASNAQGNGYNNRGDLLLPGIVVQPEVWGKYAPAIALWEAITGVPAPAPTEPGAKGAPRLSPALPEWMMGLRPGLLTDELSRPEALKGAGNGVVPLAAAAAWRLLTSPVRAGDEKGTK